MSNSNHDPKNKECLLNHLDPICFPSGNVRPVLHIDRDMNGKKFVCPYSVCTCRPEQKEKDRFDELLIKSVSQKKKEEWMDDLEALKYDEYSHRDDDAPCASNYTIRGYKYHGGGKRRPCDCGAEKNWNELCNLIRTQIALAEQRGRDAQQKEDYEIAKAQQEKAFKSGAEMGEEWGRDSERNRIYAVMRHLDIDVGSVIKLRKEWDSNRLSTLTQKS